MGNEVDGACGMHGRGEKRVQGFGGTAVRKKTTGRQRHRWEEGSKMEWIHLAQDRDRWWAFVNVVMNIQVLAPRR
jgi:hypothetical protein